MTYLDTPSSRLYVHSPSHSSRMEFLILPLSSAHIAMPTQFSTKSVSSPHTPPSSPLAVCQLSIHQCVTRRQAFMSCICQKAHSGAPALLVGISTAGGAIFV